MSRFSGSNKTDASAGQGRGARAPTAAQRRTLDGPLQSVGHNRSENRFIDFAQVNRVVSLAMVLAHYGVHLKRSGSQLVGCCPIHRGSNPRQFVVHPSTGNFFCFGDCNRGGAGALEFVSQYERVPIARAAQLVADWFALPISPRPARPQQPRSTRMNARPSHRAYVVEDRQGNADTEQATGFWTRCGSAWLHKDGKGLNIQIVPGLAVTGRLILREYTPEDEAADAAKKTKRGK